MKKTVVANQAKFRSHIWPWVVPVSLSALSLMASLAKPAAAQLQPGTPSAVPADAGSALLPLKDVMLFSSGVGYFQHSGSIDGAADIPLSFRSTHVDDILKSLIIIDPAGRVEPATYSSQEPVEKVLQSFGIDVSANPSMVQLLEQLRGVRVQVTTKGAAPQTITGQVLSVETHYARRDPLPETPTDIVPRPVPAEEISSVNLLTDTGIRSIPLSDVADLTILDPTLAAQLHQALSVLATTRDSQQKQVTLHFGQAPRRTVQVGYVTEAPLWKTSYRLAVGGTEKPYMQGWALVDNPSDQDWKDINLTLVSGQPISFIQDLYTPLYLSRPVVPPEVQANPYPQMSEDDLLSNAKKAAAQAAGAAPLEPQVRARRGIVNGAMGSFGGAASAAPESIAAPAPMAPPLQDSGVTSAAATARVGELFQYHIKQPVTIPRQQSAMIPIITDTVKAEKLDVYNPNVNPQNPSNAVEVTNTTGLHLKAGPVTIFDDGAYAGDARMPEVEPGQLQLLTYAVDLGISATRENANDVTRLTSISIKHGVLNLTRKERIDTKYTLKSKLDRDRTVLVEQPLREEWTLVEPAKPDERTRTYYRFRVPVAAGESKTFDAVEEHTSVETVGLVDADVNLLLQYQQNGVVSPAVKAALADIAQRKSKIAQLNDQIAAQKARVEAISTEQARIRQNMGQLDRESALYKRYVAQLDTQETQLEKIRAEIDRLQALLTQAQSDLRTTIDNLNVE